MRKLTEDQVTLYSAVVNALTFAAAFGTYIALKGEADWVQWGAGCVAAFVVWAGPLLILHAASRKPRWSELTPVVRNVAKLPDGLVAFYVVTFSFCTACATWYVTDGLHDAGRALLTAAMLLVSFLGIIRLLSRIMNRCAPQERKPIRTEPE